MRRFFSFIVLFCAIECQCFPQSYVIPANVKRIVFLGNSITYAGTYVSYIETVLTLQHPDKHYEFINVGLPSETVSGLSEPNHAEGRFPRPDLHERLGRVLNKIKPDLVFACYGMNDGIYLPYNEERFHKYIDGLKWLHDEVIKSGASIIHITPPVFDERKGPAYANVLDIYSDWLLSCRYTLNWSVIDIHWPMKKDLEDRRLIDSTFRYAEDGVHPNEIGHFVMAKQILLFLGEAALLHMNDIKSAIANYPNGEKILRLVEKRQEIMKDAWLSYTGHKRPGMSAGLPMAEAQHKNDELERQIQGLLKKSLQN